MGIQLYYNYINDALSRYSLDELIPLWQESVYLGSTGVITRTLISKSIPDIAHKYKFELKEDASFKDLVYAYYESRYAEYGNIKLSDKVEVAAKTKDKTYLNFVMNKVKKIYDADVDKAALEQPYWRRPEFIEMERDITDRCIISAVIDGAVKTDDIKYLNYILNKYGYDKNKLNNMLHYAIRDNRLEPIVYLLGKGAYPEGVDLEYVAITNNLKIIQLILNQWGEVRDKALWSHGENGAKLGGYTELRKFFICKVLGKNIPLPTK